MLVCDSKDNKSYLCFDTNETIFASRWRVSIKKNQVTEQHGIREREYCVYLTFSIALFTSFNRQEKMFVCDSKDNKSNLRDTKKKQFLLADEEFSKTHITQQHGITECEYYVYLTFSFSLFTSTDRRWCLFPIQKITKAIFATPTKQFLLADEEFSSKKNQITEQHGITEREYCVFSRFHFHYSPHSTDRKWCLFAIRKISKAIFATPTKQFLRADEDFSSKTHITQQHGITECEYCVYLTFSFSIFTSFNRQEAMFVCDSKDNKIYLCDINETNFASRWSFHQKNPNNGATWNYGTWVLRLSHVFIFNIHLIQQTGSDVCLRFKR